MPDKFNKSNPYTIQNIKLWCKLNNKPFKLVGSKYDGSTKELKWQCLNDKCKEIFYLSWSKIYSLDQNCPYCVGCKVGISNCLTTKRPDLAAEWHPTKNGSLTPYDVTDGNNKQIWWICNKGHEWISEIKSRKYSNCPYCCGKYASKEYNLLVSNPVLCFEWNYRKNKNNPQDFTPISGQKVWWKCSICNYEWVSSISNRNRLKRGCPLCNESKGEKQIKNILDQKQIKYEYQKTYNNLIGIGGGDLSYDFYLLDYNLLIEYQGEFHDGNGNYYVNKNLQTQQEHDKRKRQYAQDNNINLLEIWYWDFDKIEDILNKELLRNSISTIDNSNN